MIKTLTAMLLATSLLIGCTDNQFECTGRNPEGVWEVHYTTLSGNCGTIPDGLVNFNESESSDTECRTTAKVSNNECTVESSTFCTDAETYILESTAYLEWVDRSYITGKLDFYVQTIDGNCTGLYEVEYFKL